MKRRIIVFGILLLIMVIGQVTISVISIESTSNQSDRNKTSAITLPVNKFRFFQKLYIESELGDYYILRDPSNPYWSPIWPGPIIQILAKLSPRWSFSSNNNNIKCYKTWKEIPGGVPEPTGEPILNAKKIWFHDWTAGGHYDYNNYKLGGVVYNIFVLGS